MLRIARKLVWFCSPEEALERPQVFLTQVMTHGTLEDVTFVRKLVGLEPFRTTLENASPGMFDPRSWSYWNLICGRWPAPPLPKREFAD